MKSEKSKMHSGGEYGTRGENVRNSSRHRKKKSRKQNIIIYFMLVLLVVAVGVGVSFTLIFNTQKIEVVNSAERYSDEAVIKAAGIKTGDNMPSMNVGEISRRVRKQLPYIKDVHIKRAFNATVTLTVEYAKPALAFETPLGYILLDSSGKVLETGVKQLADYVAEVKGAELSTAVPGEAAVFENSDMFTYATGLASDFENAGFRNVTALDFSDLSSIMAEIDYRITVKLGNITTAAARLKFGKEVIDENLSGISSARLVIDLTQNGTAYVRTEENVKGSTPSAEGESTLPNGEAVFSGGENAGASENNISVG